MDASLGLVRSDQKEMGKRGGGGGGEGELGMKGAWKLFPHSSIFFVEGKLLSVDRETPWGRGCDVFWRIEKWEESCFFFLQAIYTFSYPK